ncbi:MAG: protein kinase [Planctomycetes bacterium]|nr:protein kinase [Planctomycetota bacterium]
MVSDLSRTQATQGNKPPSPGDAPFSATQVTKVGGVNAVTPATQSSDRPSQVLTDLNVPGAGQPAGRDKGVGTHTKQVWGDFELGELLGRGGMGSVYKGRQVSLDRPVAIKVLPPHLSENENFRARFGLEAKAVARLSSPNVIQVFGAGVHQGHHYFAMEYVEGEDLSRRIKQGLRPSYREALELIIQAVRGLVAAGDHGLVHRDIKPANMMITGKGVLKLMDFGLVKLARSEESGLTMAGTIMGTVNYFSPEQGRGEPCDHRTDLYAIGVVFYELLTGKLPFTGADATSVIYQHIHQAPKAPKEIDPNIPEDYQAVVLTCLQKRADDRYSTAQALLSDLEALQQGRSPNTAFIDPAAIRAGGMVVRSDPFAKERPSRVGMVLAVLAVVAVGAGAWFVLRPQDRSAIVGNSPASSSTLLNPAVQPTRPDRAQLLEDAREMLEAGAWATARARIAAGAKGDPSDAEWAALAKEVDRREGQAQKAFAAGDLNRAGTFAASAQALLGDSPELADLNRRLSEREGGAKQRQRLLDEARSQLGAGNPAKAEEILARLALALPDDSEVSKELRLAAHLREEQSSRQSALREQLENGTKAFDRKDYDAAQMAFTAALQHDPASVAASDGLAAVNRAKEMVAAFGVRFQDALKRRDLVEAEQQLSALREAAPSSAALLLAENQLRNSRLVEDEQRKRQAELEATLSDKAKAVLAVIEDRKQDIPAMEKALADFLASAGGDRPEKVALQVRIEDRRQLLRLESGLVGLDRAMAGKDVAAIAKVVHDAAFASALTRLMAYPGLVFESRVEDFVRDGASAKATIAIRHALDVFPERTLMYRYDIRDQPDGWVIVAAQLQQ